MGKGVQCAQLPYQGKNTMTDQKLKPEYLPPQLPSTGYVRIWQIVGKPNANPPIPPLIPVCRSTFLTWVREGKAPKPVKLGVRTTAWEVSGIRKLIEKLGNVEAAGGVQ